MFSYPLALSDIDECAKNIDGCQTNCINNVYSYTCSCDEGYKLNDDARTCTGKSWLARDSCTEVVKTWDPISVCS